MYTLGDMEPATPTTHKALLMTTPELTVDNIAVQLTTPDLSYPAAQALHAYMVARRHINAYISAGTHMSILYAGLALGDAHRYVDQIDDHAEHGRAQDLHRNLVWAFEDIIALGRGGQLSGVSAPRNLLVGQVVAK